jgi:urease accessory protein UreE
MAKKIDQKFLKGLKLHFAEQRKSKKDGRDVVQNIPQERPLTQDDILDWKDYGDTVVIVTADGQKYTIDKVEKPAAGGEKEK